MLIFIDESGDAGFKFARGSSRYFVMTMLVFKKEEDARYLFAEQLKIDIVKLKKKLGLKNELKFSKLTCKIRSRFFDLLAKHQFKACYITINKETLYDLSLRTNKESFYNYVLRQMLKKFEIKNAIVNIDGHGNRIFRQELKAYLRKHIPEGNIKKVKMIDSEKDELIQVADLLAGGYMFYLKHNKDDRYIKKIGKKMNVYDFK